jgi:rod shape-determining protein MreD
MNSSPLTSFVRFLALVATQVLVMNNVQFGGHLNPYIYILFIILLPFRTPPVVMIIAGFMLGFAVDFYTGVLGIHTASTLLIAFLRNRVVRFVVGLQEDDFLDTPGLRGLGIRRFIYYITTITLIHHLTLFYLEVFTFAHFWDTLFRSLLNAVVSVLFMLVIMVLFEKKGYEQR